MERRPFLFGLSSSETIIPASITFQPNFTHDFSGSVELGGSADSRAYISKDFDSSWSIEGIFESGFLSEWSIGEGEYYWYRIEGSCGESGCDTTGVVYNACRSVTFMTIVGARNISELCENLSNPVLNPRIDFKISSIQKYSRPFERSPSDECNTLDEQEFCNVAECLDYCLDQDVRQSISFSMKAIESSFFAEMRGGIFLSGRIQTDRNRSYDPEFPVIGFLGSSESILSIVPRASFGGISLSGSSENSSTYYFFDNPSSLISILGFAGTSSPSRSLSSIAILNLSGETYFGYSPSPSGGLEFDGESSAYTLIPFLASGNIELSGRLIDYSSPFFSSAFSGLASLSGSASYNFSDYGLFRETARFLMNAFDFGSEAPETSVFTGLTIADRTVFPACGCGPMSLVLSLRHNMLNSSYLSSFLGRSGLSMGDSVLLRYKSSDGSWRSSQSFVGKGNDGISEESMSFFYSILCLDDVWVFSFSVTSSNRFTGRDLYTRLIADIPADLLCSDGSISTTMELEINGGELIPPLGRSFSVVEPSRSARNESVYRGADFYVDGIFNDKRVYYDDIGLFKNSYWSTNRLEMNINIPSGARMPELEIFRILT